MSQQTPYIGSKISLISKLDIRYEGILYTVDTNESTIALAKVRSFGTEDRPTTNPVPARNDVYDYIIFKASDIKDLIVCDTPKPVAQLSSGLAYDPAILTISSNSHVPPPPLNAPLTNAVRLSAGSSRSETPNQASGVGKEPHAELPHVTSRAPGAGRKIVRPVGSSGNDSLSATTNATQPASGGFQQQEQQQQQGQHQQPTQKRGQTGAAHHAAGVRPPVPQTGYRGMGVGQHGSFTPPQRAGQRMNTGYYPRGFLPGSFPRGRGNKTQPSAKERFKFDTDYDFEKANEQFQETLNNITQDLKKTKLDGDGGSEKESTGSEAGPDVIEEGEVLNNEEDSSADNYYDKSSSFFDRISCEALEKQEGKHPRTDWRKERETNQQTFGHSAVRSLAYRRGRGFQGGRNMRGGNPMFRYNNGYNNYGGPRGGYSYYGYNRRGSYRPFVQQ